MNWINNINNALNFIENNLESDLSSEIIASKACSSEFHFLRSFSMLTGKTLGEYIKERRLTKAGKELATSDKKIIDIALNFAYQTPESFSKAFKRYHGITPSKARMNGHLLTVTPPLHIRVSLKGDSQMNYRIQEQNAFTVTGISREISIHNDDEQIKLFCDELWDDGTMQKMISLTGSRFDIKELSYDYNEEKGTYRLLFGIIQDSKNKGMYKESIEVQKCHWAIFSGEGSYESIAKTWKRIFEEWFPATGYEHAGLPQIESSSPISSEEHLEWNICIPIKK